MYRAEKLKFICSYSHIELAVPTSTVSHMFKPLGHCTPSRSQSDYICQIHTFDHGNNKRMRGICIDVLRSLSECDRLTVKSWM